MSRDWRLYLADVVEYADAALRFVRGLSREEFRADERTVFAVLRALEVMGEAIRNVPPDVLGRAPDIAWRRVVGFRNRLAHGYWSLDEEVVWLAVTRDLPPLRAAAAALLDEADRAGPPPA